MAFREFAGSNIVILDGAMGTMLEREGIRPGELPETWNLSHPEKIKEIHKAYFSAGSNVVNTNTFGANTLKYDEKTLCEIIKAAVNCASDAKDECGGDNKFVALDIGPTGRMLKPFGDLDFEDAYKVFSTTARIGIECGVDLITIETMNDIMETKAALLAVRDLTDLPIIVTNAYGSDGKLLSGASPEVMAALLCGMGADFIGANCSLGPDALLPVMERLSAASSVPLALKANAGLPKMLNGDAYYDVSEKEFARVSASALSLGVRLFGGCCGTTPEYIKELTLALKDAIPCQVSRKKNTVITSYCRALNLDKSITLIGERINPTGKKRMREAILANDIDCIVNLGVEQEELLAHALDVNVGVPGISECEMLKRVVMALQYSVSLPLVIDTSDPSAMEAAVRIYAGKPMLNSVNGKEESMAAVFPIVKRYGGVVIALTLDESGIPATVEGRMAIARKILARAEQYGIDRSDIVFDPLAMAVSADKNSASVTVETIRRIRAELGCHTSLGVSNISFGLPSREAVNTAFFSMALGAGLSAAIMNPKSPEMMRTYYSAKALLGLDDNFSDYISRVGDFTVSNTVSSSKSEVSDSATVTLGEAIIKGLPETAVKLADKLLSNTEPLDIINGHIVPALDTVGAGFEAGKIFLPGLLLSAETAKAAFERIKASVKTETGKKRGTVVIATVRGDIHDIGKNIVKLLLENYGFSVVDLGKDVAPQKIVESALENNADIVALSALMTTTVSAMAETVKLLRSSASRARIIVGGAVLTEDYAKTIGADAYGKDAMVAVRYAERVTSSI